MFRNVGMSLLACVLLLTAVGCGPVLSSGASSETGSDLTARIDAPATLTTGETVPVRFTLTNNTDEKLYVLKWYTPLEGIAGKIFRVERDGEVLEYGGILASRAAPSADSYVLLEPGASASAEVDLAPSYDFSQAGKYTIEFLSPRISHVARSEADMATSLDDLGPVEMPSNAVTVEIDSSGASNDRLRPEEAEALVRGYLHSEKPDLKTGFPLPMQELPAAEVWAHLPVQIFRVTDGPFAQETFLAHDGTVVQLGTAVGGQGVTALRVSDLDGDGAAEVLFTYSFGSGIHQSRVGMVAPAYAQDRVFEAETGYLGDVGLVKESMSHVAVRLVEPDQENRILRYTHTLGHLEIEGRGAGERLVLQIAEDLPDDVREKLVQASA